MDPWFVILLCRIQWTDEHHALLLREILATEPFKYKPRTQQRINLWNTVVAHLDDVTNPAFTVTQRAVKDKFCLLKEKHIAKEKEQDKASSIDVEETEIDVLLEEIIEKEKYSQSEYKDKDEEHERKVEKGKATAAVMRQKVMESLGETLKRSRTDSEESGEEKKKIKMFWSNRYLQGKNEQGLE